MQYIQFDFLLSSSALIPPTIIGAFVGNFVSANCDTNGLSVGCNDGETDGCLDGGSLGEAVFVNGDTVGKLVVGMAVVGDAVIGDLVGSAVRISAAVAQLSFDNPFGVMQSQLTNPDKQLNVTRLPLQPEFPRVTEHVL